LNAWVTTSEGKPFTDELTYIWSVSTGRIRNEATAETRWELENSKPGNYVATVRAEAPSKEVAECSLQVVVEPQVNEIQRSSARQREHETGRTFLLPKEKEHEGYGLYSYLILGGPPSDSSRERYLKVIEAYLLALPDIAGLERHFMPDELNITYLPVAAEPPKTTDIKLLTGWVLDHYDYARARHLIRQLSGDNREGPYLVSVSTPLSNQAPVSNFLWQDLSAVPAQFAGPWLKEFMNQAAQEHFWETRSLPQLRLKVRSVIAVLSMAWPDVWNSLDSYIKLGQSISP
jgi:hypothetical protein